MAADTTKKSATFEIVVDDGTIRVPIKNTLGDEIGSFKFRPTDTGLLERYREALGRVDDAVEPLANASIKADGTADEEVEGAVEAVQEAQKRLGDLLDFIFDGNAAEAFFSGMRPFSPIGGRFYYEIALESLGNFITARYKDEGKKLNKRVLDYTKKYGKGTGKA